MNESTTGGGDRKKGGGVSDALKVMFRTKRCSLVRKPTDNDSCGGGSSSHNKINASHASSVQYSWRSSRTTGSDNHYYQQNQTKQDKKNKKNVRKNRWKKLSGVEKRNEGIRLKRVLAKFRCNGSLIRDANVRSTSAKRPCPDVQMV